MIKVISDAEEQIFKKRHYAKKSECKNKGIKYNLEWTDFRDLYYLNDGKDWYTDEPMKLKGSRGKTRDVFSVDRVDPDKGYIKFNLLPACGRTNTNKGDRSINELERDCPEWYIRVKEAEKLGHIKL